MIEVLGQAEQAAIAALLRKVLLVDECPTCYSSCGDPNTTTESSQLIQLFPVFRQTITEIIE